MAHTYPQGVGANAIWKLNSRRLCQALGPAISLLACAAAMSLLTGVGARSLQTSRSGLDTLERRLQSVALPAGNANEGWTLGRANWYNPSESLRRQVNV